jgi:hypothetical protein
MQTFSQFSHLVKLEEASAASKSDCQNSDMPHTKNHLRGERVVAENPSEDKMLEIVCKCGGLEIVENSTVIDFLGSRANGRLIIQK